MRLLLDCILGLLPIIWLVIALTGLKWPGYRAALGAMLIAAAEAVIIFRFSVVDTATSMPEGFGTAVAIPASMLWVLEFDPITACLVCLIANATPTPFGSIGIPTLTLASNAGLSTNLVSLATVAELSLLIILTPFIMVMIVGKGFKAFKGIVPVILISRVAFLLPEAIVAYFVGPELAVVAGSVCALVATIFASMKLTKTDNIEFEENVVQLTAQLKSTAFSTTDFHGPIGKCNPDKRWLIVIYADDTIVNVSCAMRLLSPIEDQVLQCIKEGIPASNLRVSYTLLDKDFAENTRIALLIKSKSFNGKVPLGSPFFVTRDNFNKYMKLPKQCIRISFANKNKF